MKILRLEHFVTAAALLAIASLLVGLAWRAALEASDYAAQGGLVLLIIGLPFCAHFRPRFLKHFGVLFLVGAAWGVWRLLYFDPLAHNDVPGIAYLFAPFMMVGMSAIILVVRASLVGAGSKARS